MNNRNISRRTLMRASVGALLSAGLWPGALAAQDVAAPDFDFICANDLHYIDEVDLPFLQDMIAKMKQSSPKATMLLVVGDLCENGTPAQLTAMRDLLKQVDRPMHFVIGNHDWTAQNDRAAFEQICPNSINYTFDYHGWQFVALDTSFGVEWQNTAVQKPTFDWLDQNLPKLDKKRPMILFTHFPLGEGVQYRPTNAEDVLSRFKEFNLRAVFNGHFHGTTERARGEFLITTNKCCANRRANHDGTKEKGFLACSTKDGKVLRQFVQVA